MDIFFEDCFLVFVRADTAHNGHPEINEEPLAVCNSYEEARRVKSGTVGNCIIRFAGCAGGGD